MVYERPLPERFIQKGNGGVYHSKVVILCWAVVYLAAVVAAVIKRRWPALRHVLAGAAIVAAGIGLSAALNSSLGALLLSAALMVAAYFTLTGIIGIFKS